MASALVRARRAHALRLLSIGMVELQRSSHKTTPDVVDPTSRRAISAIPRAGCSADRHKETVGLTFQRSGTVKTGQAAVYISHRVFVLWVVSLGAAAVVCY
jgi:hypothetical protein